MSVETQRHGGGGGGYVERAPGGGSSSLADVVALILDKGLVIDVFIRVSLVGIEILTIDARIVVASVDTYLRFAEATNAARTSTTRAARRFPTLPRGSPSTPPDAQHDGAAPSVAGRDSVRLQPLQTEGTSARCMPSRRQTDQSL